MHPGPSLRRGPDLAQPLPRQAHLSRVEEIAQLIGCFLDPAVSGVVHRLPTAVAPALGAAHFAAGVERVELCGELAERGGKRLLHRRVKISGRAAFEPCDDGPSARKHRTWSPGELDSGDRCRQGSSEHRQPRHLFGEVVGVGIGAWQTKREVLPDPEDPVAAAGRLAGAHLERREVRCLFTQEFDGVGSVGLRTHHVGSLAADSASGDAFSPDVEFYSRLGKRRLIFSQRWEMSARVTRGRAPA